jgi:hypothetical protein
MGIVHKCIPNPAGQYQALSQDPNSLSNLDQDLPNNMIHQVRLGLPKIVLVIYGITAEYNTL